MDERHVGLWLHSSRPEAVDAAVAMARGLAARGIACQVAPERADEMRARLAGVPVGLLGAGALPEAELLVVLGGDGTILSAAEWALPRQVPLLGVNMGHVGFLAELEASEQADLVERIDERAYKLERRVTLSVEVRGIDGDDSKPGDGGAPCDDPDDQATPVLWQSFAVNELSIEKAVRSRMLDVLVLVDGKPLSRWACDGMLVSTPSGSTAYAFSAGGPVIWPDVAAIELVPLLAHALFARPLVLSPESVIEVHLADESDAAAFWCDGRRRFVSGAGATAVVTRHPLDLRLARLGEQPFTTRLVKKFQLPVDGWRHGARRGGSDVDASAHP